MLNLLAGIVLLAGWMVAVGMEPLHELLTCSLASAVVAQLGVWLEALVGCVVGLQGECWPCCWHVSGQAPTENLAAMHQVGGIVLPAGWMAANGMELWRELVTCALMPVVVVQLGAWLVALFECVADRCGVRGPVAESTCHRKYFEHVHS